MSAIPIAPNLLSTEPQLRLLGGRHRGSGKIVFPLPDDAMYETIELPPRGLLWSYTVQRFAPKSPPYRGGKDFVPFAVGYVELPGVLIIESRLAEIRFERLQLGMPMELTTLYLGDDDVGWRQSYAFRPAVEAGGAS